MLPVLLKSPQERGKKPTITSNNNIIQSIITTILSELVAQKVGASPSRLCRAVPKGLDRVLPCYFYQLR